jgi:hypothetical protein
MTNVKYHVYGLVTIKPVAEVMDQVNQTMAGFGFHDKLIAAQETQLFTVSGLRHLSEKDQHLVFNMCNEKMKGIDLGYLKIIRLTKMVKEAV